MKMFFGPFTFLTSAARERYTGLVAMPKKPRTASSSFETEKEPAANEASSVPASIDESLCGAGEALSSLSINYFCWWTVGLFLPAVVDLISVRLGGPTLIGKDASAVVGTAFGTLAGIKISAKQFFHPVEVTTETRVMPKLTPAQERGDEPSPPSKQKSPYEPSFARKAGRAAIYLAAASMLVSQVNDMRQTPFWQTPSTPDAAGQSQSKPGPTPQ